MHRMKNNRRIIFCVLLLLGMLHTAVGSQRRPSHSCLSHAPIAREYNSLCHLYKQGNYEGMIDIMLAEKHHPVEMVSSLHSYVREHVFTDLFTEIMFAANYTPVERDCHKITVHRHFFADLLFTKHKECLKQVADYYKQTIPIAAITTYKEKHFADLYIEAPPNTTTATTTTTTTPAPTTRLDRTEKPTTDRPSPSITESAPIAPQGFRLSSSPLNAITCAHCNGFQCFISNKPVRCPAGRLCMTKIKDTATGDRHIEKTCGTTQQCFNDWWEHTARRTVCSRVNHGLTYRDLSCTFCCTSDGCNAHTSYLPSDLAQFNAEGALLLNE